MLGVNGEVGRRLLEVLPARFRPLVDQHDAQAGLRGDRGRDQPGGAAADHENVRTQLGLCQLGLDRSSLRGIGRRGEDRSPGLNVHRHHPVRDRRHAGEPAGDPVDEDRAFRAQPHPAGDPASVTGVGPPAHPLVGDDQHGATESPGAAAISRPA
jgi:hypothetical protein